MRAVPGPGAVAASAPLILAALGAGALGAAWACADGGTSALERAAWQALSGGALLLPVVVTWALLRTPRRATPGWAVAALLAGVAAASATVTAGAMLPGDGLAAQIPWSTMACYVVTLVATAWAPLPRPEREVVLWGAAIAAAWTPLVFTFVNVLSSAQDPTGRDLTVRYYALDVSGAASVYVSAEPGALPVVSGRPDLPGLVYSEDVLGDVMGSWADGAAVFGPPLVIVALAAALSTESGRRVAGYVAGALVAEFALLGPAASVAGSQISPVDWSLVLGALFVLAATRIRPRAWADRLRSLRTRIPLQGKDLAFWTTVTVAAVWLVVTSFS